MNLFYRTYGEGAPVLILHGLYGSSDNWISFAKMLNGNFQLILIDQRNHGRSPHHKTHNYKAMSDDLLKFIETNLTEPVHIIGHSMGGKTAMTFASQFPEMVKSLIVIDIAPKKYHVFDQPHPNAKLHLNIINSLKNMDINNINSLKDADKALAHNIGSEKIRSFLLKKSREK